MELTRNTQILIKSGFMSVLAATTLLPSGTINPERISFLAPAQPNGVSTVPLTPKANSVTPDGYDFVRAARDVFTQNDMRECYQHLVRLPPNPPLIDNPNPQPKAPNTMVAVGEIFCLRVLPNKAGEVIAGPLAAGYTAFATKPDPRLPPESPDATKNSLIVYISKNPFYPPFATMDIGYAVLDGQKVTFTGSAKNNSRDLSANEGQALADILVRANTIVNNGRTKVTAPRGP